MMDKLNPLALNQALAAVGQHYGIENLPEIVRAVYDKIDAVHNERIKVLLEEGKTVENDRELFVAALQLELGAPQEVDTDNYQPKENAAVEGSECPSQSS